MRCLLELFAHHPGQLDQVDARELERQLAQLQSLQVEHGVHPVGHQVGLFKDVGGDLARTAWGGALLSGLGLQQLCVGLDDRDRRTQLMDDQAEDAIPIR